MKLLICPDSKDVREYVERGVDAFLFGMDHFSVNMLSLTLTEIKQFRKNHPDCALFVSFNKNIFPEELEQVEQLLCEFSHLSLAGILFYDLALVRLNEKLQLHLPLVWNQTHMVVNHNACNFYYDHGVSMGVMASEITVPEIVEIASSSSMKFIVPMVGYPIMAHSRRKLLSNYFKFIQEEKKKMRYHLQEKHGKVDLYSEEDATGTTFYFGSVLNGTKAFFELQEVIEYALFYEKGIQHEQFLKMVELYQEMMQRSSFSQEEKEYYIRKATDILGSNYTGFFFQKTIYKVK